MANVTFSSINVVNGVELGDTPQVLMRQAGKRSARGGETLILFLDFPSASPSAFADVARVLGDGFARAPGGVTSALRLAIKLANDRILQLNRGTPPSQRLEGSLSCALISGEGVVIAQAGPALAFARSASGAFEVIAPYSEGASQVVGITPALDVHFNNIVPQPGDVFVLTGARSCIGVSDALVGACMSKGDARMVAGYLNANVKQGRMAGVALSVMGAAAAPLPTAAAPVVTAPRVAGPTAASPAVSPAAAPAASPVGESVMSGVNQAARSIQRSVTAFGGRLLPQETPAEAAQRSRTTTFLLAAIAVLIPVAVAVAVAVLYFQFSGEAERLQMRNSALAQVQAASSVADPAQARADWGKALELIAAYESSNPQDVATFGAAKAQARERLDQIGQITRVQPALLTALEGDAPRRIAASALGIYVLTPETNAAEYYVLNADRSGTTGKKVSIAMGDGVTTTSSLADVAWATTIDDRWRTEGAVFFGTDVLYEYSSATGRAMPMSIPATADATPQQIKAGELYNNTVYLLDVGVGQIWRYPAGVDGLAEGNSYFGSPFSTLRDGVDFAIDGAIYVLKGNGAILKYFSRRPLDFSTSGLPETPQRAVAIATSTTSDPNRGVLYVLDAGTGSVIELTKTGQFIRQYRGDNDEFVDAQDMSFDGTSNTLYVATRGSLYSFLVQPPPAPPAPTPTQTP
jgi:hypothetical protein